MPTIRVSDEVFNVLKRLAEPLVDTPDSVMRRVLGLDAAVVSGKTGNLYPLLQSGALAAGDQLVWHRKRLGERHVTTVTANGSLELADGRIASSPSGACTMLSGKSYDGWEMWQRADNVFISALRPRP